jgi:hypothetical protein
MDVMPELQIHVSIFFGKKPCIVTLQLEDCNNICYFIADAFCEGFGSVTQDLGLSVEVREGLWDGLFDKGSSNLWKMGKRGNNLSRDINNGKHNGCEVWMVMDNSTWLHIWTKAISLVQPLFGKVLEIKVAAFAHMVFLKLLHISGRCMIAIGVDGISQGDSDVQVMVGFDARMYLPLEVSSFDVKGNHLESWCKSQIESHFSPPLSPQDWIRLGHMPDIHIWAPTPMA